MKLLTNISSVGRSSLIEGLSSAGWIKESINIVNSGVILSAIY